MASSITELRNELQVIFRELRDGKLEPRQAKEMNNAAGKIIGTLKVELEYSHLRGEKPKIAFFGGR